MAFQLVNALAGHRVRFGTQTDLPHGLQDQPDNQRQKKQAAGDGSFQNRHRTATQIEQDLIHETNIERFGAKAHPRSRRGLWSFTR